MLYSPFEATRLKLRRARSHIDELSEYVTEYLRRDPFYMEIVVDPGFRNGRKWLVTVREEAPPYVSTIIGDAIHNLRTSLDILACELVIANGGSDNDVYFPFASSADDLEEKIRKRHITRSKPGVVELIRKSKPYIGGNYTLRALHDLDITDKHRALIPVIDVIGLPGFSASPVRSGVAFAITDDQINLPTGRRESGKFILRFEGTHDTIDGKESASLRGGENIPTLVALSHHVEGLVESLILVA
jgi:hypothetical protein